MEATVARRAGRAPFLQPLAVRNFRLVWLGESISLLGDQCHFVALAWLTLQLTGSGFALGTVLMAAAIPRAVFMLVGGAFSDRLSTRAIMLASNGCRAVLVAAISTLVFLHLIALWQLYALAIVFGFVDAFFYPAVATMPPLLLDKDRLAAGNALMQTSQQVSTFIGPALAGLLVAASGTGLVFAIDAGTFVVATVALGLMRDEPVATVGAPAQDREEGDTGPARGGLVATIGAGLVYAWRDPVLRVILLIVAAINFSFSGPMSVGLAYLADHRFSGGSAAFGAMLSGWGAGTVLGIVVAGTLARNLRMGQAIVGVTAAMGVGLVALGVAPTALVAVIVLLAMGVVNGMVNVLAVSWLQMRTDPAMLGRVMSLVMLAGMGLGPLSYAVSGVLVGWSVAALFVGAGAIVLVAAVCAMASRLVREVT